MSIQLGSLVSNILNDHFGEIVQKVGTSLFRYGSQPIGLIIKSSLLPKSQIVQALRVLIKYDLVSFEPSKNEAFAEYKLLKENVLCLMRYPKYLMLIKNKYGCEAELIVEEIFKEGSITLVDLIVNIMTKTKDDVDKNLTVVSLRDTLVSLVTAGYIRRCPLPTLESIDADVPILEQTDPSKHLLPEVKILRN